LIKRKNKDEKMELQTNLKTGRRISEFRLWEIEPKKPVDRDAGSNG
jgi:hypothetical protein